MRREAANRGVDPNRLVFAPRLPLAEHLARHRLADLFLGTQPCNAHTTSSALWAGFPVLTCAGEAFAGRVSASFLTAIDVPELITSSGDAYEALALEFAANPEEQGGIRRKLEQNRLTTALFDAARFTKHVEAAYVAMSERHRAGLPPGHIHVA